MNRLLTIYETDLHCKITLNAWGLPNHIVGINRTKNRPVFPKKSALVVDAMTEPQKYYIYATFLGTQVSTWPSACIWTHRPNRQLCSITVVPAKMSCQHSQPCRGLPALFYTLKIPPRILCHCSLSLAFHFHIVCYTVLYWNKLIKQENCFPSVSLLTVCMESWLHTWNPD